MPISSKRSARLPRRREVTRRDGAPARLLVGALLSWSAAACSSGDDASSSSAAQGTPSAGSGAAGAGTSGQAADDVCRGSGCMSSAAGAGGGGGTDAIAGDTGGASGNGGAAAVAAPAPAGMADGGTSPATDIARGDGSWSMMGQDALGWYTNTRETALSVDNAASLVERWRFTVAGYPPGSPVIAEGKVFVMATGGTYAIDLESGDEVWRRSDLGGTASVAYAEGSVYLHDRGANLYRLSAADGATQWGPEKSYDLRGCDGTSSPIVAGGLVMVGHSCGALEVGFGSGQDAARGGVEAHDTETGAKRWTYWTVPQSGENGAMVWSSVAVDLEAGVAFATTGNNYTLGGPNSDAIHAIDLSTGDGLWVRQLNSGDVWSMPSFEGGPDADFGANPIVADVDGRKVVAAGDKGSAFWALDRDSGEVLWGREELTASRSAANGGVLMNGAFDGRAFYAVANDPDGNQALLHAFDPGDGSALWPARSFSGMTWGAPSLANGVLLVPIHTTLHVLDAATSETLTSFETGGTIAAGAAAVSDGRIVVASGLQFIYAPDAVNNNQIICYGQP